MKKERAIFGAGCFWHVQEFFSKIPGVVETTVGYSGGNMKNPSYEQVSSGKTGHAEVIEIMFDSEKISYGQLLGIFWRIHNPTTLNRQGADIGINYRSVIFYLNNRQKQIAVESKKEIQKKFDDKIVTEIIKFSEFYPAEEYHQMYFEKHKNFSCAI